MDYKIIFTILWVLITFIWYYFYIWDIFKWKNKPHLYSWIIWAIWLLIWFWIQFNNDWWYWSFITLFEALFCIIIVFIAVKKWEKNITTLDKVSLLFWFISIIFWIFLKQPIISVILIILIDSFWFIPTFRKSYIKPFEESISVYLVWWILFTFSIISLTNYNFLTYGYPLAIIILDTSLILMILYRRKLFKKLK